MLRKVCMVFIDVVLGPYGVAVQALVALLLLVCMLVSTIVARPFQQRHLGNLEIFSLCTSSSTLWLGAFFWAVERESAMTLHQIVSILIVGINVIFMAFLFYVLGKDACRDYGVADRFSRFSRMIDRRSVSSESSGGEGIAKGTASLGDILEAMRNANDNDQQHQACEGESLKKEEGRGEGKGAAAKVSNHNRVTSVGNPLVNNNKNEAQHANGVGIASASTLPTGWIELSDEASGASYYSNTLTGNVQWERPTASASVLQGGGMLRRIGTFIPEGWQRINSNGQKYYVTPTGSSQWEKPPGNPH